MKAVIVLGSRVVAARSTISFETGSCTPMRMPLASEKVTKRIKKLPGWFSVEIQAATITPHVGYGQPRAEHGGVEGRFLTILAIGVNRRARMSLGMHLTSWQQSAQIKTNSNLVASP
ncbi:MAG: hypothetical protein ACK4N4_11625 [Burkholderiales bacterium]